MQENADTSSKSPGPNPRRKGAGGIGSTSSLERSSGGRLKLGSLNINIPQSHYDRFDDPPTSSNGKSPSVLGEVTDNANAKGEGQAAPLTKLKSKPTLADSGGNNSRARASHDNKIGEEEDYSNFTIPDFVSSVPKSDDLFGAFPPLSSFYNLSMSATPPPPPVYNYNDYSPYMSMPPNYPYFMPSPLSSVPSMASVSAPPDQTITAMVMEEGFIRLSLNYEVVLDITTDMAIRIQNTAKQSAVTLSESGKHASIIHPKGRVLVYEPRVEIQTEDDTVKNAKVYPRGVSFTANNMALVYLLDEAGARSTSDMFHDLYATNIVDTLFEESCAKDIEEAVRQSIDLLDRANYWKTEAQVDCWIFNEIFVQQTVDGLVIVERTSEDGTKITMKASPSNGKIRLNSNFVQVINVHSFVLFFPAPNLHKCR